MAGQTDFTLDEWTTMQRALVAAGVLVSLAEGVVDADEILALMDRLGAARTGHPNPLVRELARMDNFATGLQHGTTFADYRGPGLELIRSAAAAVARKAPADLPAYCGFVIELGEAVAYANKEGGFLGLGGQRRTPAEAAAIESLKRALGVEG